jgi:hypothetical protein
MSQTSPPMKPADQPVQRSQSYRITPDRDGLREMGILEHWINTLKFGVILVICNQQYAILTLCSENHAHPD